MEECFTVEECNTNPRDKMIEFDEDDNAQLHFKNNYYSKKDELLTTNNFTTKNLI